MGSNPIRGTIQYIMAKDLYEILGIGKAASEDEIKRAFRKLAQKHHPDQNKNDKGAEAKFKEISGAYEILSDKKKRQQYDQFGESAFAGGGGGQAGGFDYSNFSGFGESFSDIFETFFGGGGGRSRRKNGTGPEAGENREIRITITFEEAAFGGEKEVKITRIAQCQNCGGKGMAPGSKIITCPACSGSGEIRNIQHTILGQVTTRRVCDTCRGTGKIPQNPCAACDGIGRVRVTEKLRVKVPAGIFDGSSIRIMAKGDDGLRGGESGDLYLHIKVQPHAQFGRKDNDVYSNQHVNFLQAVLGDNVSIQTIHGPVKMHIPAGTQHGKTFRLKGHGVQKLRGEGRGDHFVTIGVKTPEKLSKKERDLYRQLARESGINIEEEKGFIKKMMGE